MNRLSEKIIMGLLALFLLVTVGYQIYLSVYGSIKTETILEYTVTRAISVEGVAIRNETVIEGLFYGIENCVFDDGTRVSIGETVAEFHESESVSQNLIRKRELEAEIKMLQDAEDGTVNNFSTAEIHNRGIREQLGALSKMSGSGQFQTLGITRANLISLINKKQIALGTATDYESRIMSLQEEYNGLNMENLGNTIMSAKAPVSGYFFRSLDGYEYELSLETVKEYTIQDYFGLIDGEDLPNPQNTIGKIVTTQNWIFAASAPRSSLEFVKPGQEVFLTIEAAGRKMPAVVMDVMQERDSDRAVILLSCNQISGDLIAVRKTDAIINFDNYTGLRVNMADVRFLGEKRGVYVLDGNTAYFREIDPVYEEQSFVLSRLIPPETYEKKYVALFDRILKGNDLYDGKIIQ